MYSLFFSMDFPGGSVVKNPPANAGDAVSIPEWGRSPWRRKWSPSPVFLSGKSHGWRSLMGYSPQGCNRVGHDLVTKQQQHILFNSDIWVSSAFQPFVLLLVPLFLQWGIFSSPFSVVSHILQTHCGYYFFHKAFPCPNDWKSKSSKHAIKTILVLILSCVIVIYMCPVDVDL